MKSLPVSKPIDFKRVMAVLMLSVMFSVGAFAKQILTSFVSCEVSNAALDKAGISPKMLMDANSSETVAAKVLAILPDSNSATVLAKPKMLIMDGEHGSIDTTNIATAAKYKVDFAASSKGPDMINAKIDWQKSEPKNPGVESVKTMIQLHSGKPAIVGCQKLGEQTRFLIITSEILDPNKPKANTVTNH
jgi:hypothetical protein